MRKNSQPNVCGAAEEGAMCQIAWRVRRSGAHARAPRIPGRGWAIVGAAVAVVDPSWACRG